MAANDEDSIPSAYKYSWSKDSSQTLEEYLQKFRPSMVQNDGTKPWIWVRGSEPQKQDKGELEAISEGSEVLNELTEKVESIKNDDSIPTRSNKKTGAKSKKEVREAAQAEATKKLEEISIKHGFVSGKWLVFASPDKVDAIWSAVAASLVSGSLASTSAHLAKVATSPQTESPNHQHIICIYIPDVYDKPKVLEVMKVLLGSHGLNLSGVKSNLYTLLGIDSKHPSGIQSTVWKNSALMPDSEMKAMKEAYFSDLAAKKSQGPQKAEEVEKETKPQEAAQNKAKPKLKAKKKANDLVFSDDEEEGEAKEVHKSKAKPKPKKAVGDFVSSDDEAPEPRKPTKKPAARKRKETSDAEGEEEQQGKAKRAKV
ncbi:hypothetical protein BKA70DRAFT_1259935 [Coprinopsis sp. MPI-PUGE-AT-0042]|nr:hypothetical protein BKA70DRAFT_1259935 [Coprinopsis sp. MPI-PUGE-AT-0042]